MEWAVRPCQVFRSAMRADGIRTVRRPRELRAARPCGRPVAIRALHARAAAGPCAPVLCAQAEHPPFGGRRAALLGPPRRVDGARRRAPSAPTADGERCAAHGSCGPPAGRVLQPRYFFAVHEGAKGWGWDDGGGLEEALPSPPALAPAAAPAAALRAVERPRWTGGRPRPADTCVASWLAVRRAGSASGPRCGPARSGPSGPGWA